MGEFVKTGEGVVQNPVLHLRERGWAGQQYQVLGKKIGTAATVTGFLGELDLLGVAAKTITVVNTGSAALGVGSIVFAGPRKGKVTESISTADFDTLAAGAVASFSSTTAHRFWDLTLVGNASADVTVDIYVDVNIHG